MAPEQAGGEGAVGPRADVFALGCLLYECIAGVAPFAAEALVGVLAKILFAEPEPLDLPPAIGKLLGLLLAKDQVTRPADAGAVVAAIDALGEIPDVPARERNGERLDAPTRVERHRHEPSAEKQLVCVLVASVPAPLPEELRTRLGLEVLADSAVAARFVPADGQVATDLAWKAARASLDIVGAQPGARISLTMGRSVVDKRSPIGELIDRAAARLPAQPGIVVDELSAALLARRFDVTQGSRLVSEHADPDALRPLLGKPTPCLGRDQELSTLETALATAIDDGAAGAIVITGAAGMGKSRLRHELVRRVRAKYPDLMIVSGASDPHAGATYAVLASAIIDLGSQHELVANIARADQRRIGELLAELCGAPVAEPCPEVARARNDPKRLGEEIASAFIELLRAETAVHPVMLVLDDLHWADRASLKLVERVLTSLADHPLLIVGLARPTAAGPPWSGRALHVPLRPLGKRAAERLVVEVLGPDVEREVVARVVAQAAGNALFLEELIRAVADGRRELPDTVLAILQSRIGNMRPELRRVLRAASVFGDKFTRDGAAALLQEPSTALDDHLSELVRNEIIEARGEGFAFRHALVSEAAYSMIEPDDREAAHRAAAAYLENLGGHEPLELAEHYQRGRALDQAVAAFLRAAYEAAHVGDTASARLHFAAASDSLRELPDNPEHRRTRVDILIQQVSAGIMADTFDLQVARTDTARELLASVEPDTSDVQRRITLDLLSARVLLYGGQPASARDAGTELAALATRAGDERLALAAAQLQGNAWMMQGNVIRAEPLLGTGAAKLHVFPTDQDRVRVLGNHAMCLAMLGQYHEARALHARNFELAAASKQPSPLALALTIQAGSERFVGDPRERETIVVAIEHAIRGNDRLPQQLMEAQLAYLEARHGNRAAAERARGEALAIADELGGDLCFWDLRVGSDVMAAWLFGEHDEAIALAKDAVPRLRAENMALGLGLTEQAWGLALAAKHDPDAEAHLTAARAVFTETGQAMARARLELCWAKLGGPRAAELRASAAETYLRAGVPELIDLLEQQP